MGTLWQEAQGLDPFGPTAAVIGAGASSVRVAAAQEKQQCKGRQVDAGGNGQEEDGNKAGAGGPRPVRVHRIEVARKRGPPHQRGGQHDGCSGTDQELEGDAEKQDLVPTRVAALVWVQGRFVECFQHAGLIVRPSPECRAPQWSWLRLVVAVWLPPGVLPGLVQARRYNGPAVPALQRGFLLAPATAGPTADRMPPCRLD